MHKKILRPLCLCLAFLLLSGCVATPSPTDPALSSLPSDKYAGRTLNILMDMGGMGYYYEPIIMKLQELYPGLTINSSYEQSAHELFRIKALSNSLPDISNLNQGFFDYYAAVENGYCLPVDGILDAPLPDGQTIRDVLEPEFIEYGSYEGKHYLMSETAVYAGMWYDEALFKKYGLSIPNTWEEYLSLCEELKAQGINGVGYCGNDLANEYAVCYWFLPILNSISQEAFRALEQGDPEVWRSSDMTEALGRLLELRESGYVDLSTLSLKNDQTQRKFINHDFAFLPCGTWLENEMADAWPEDFELALLPFSGNTKKSDPDYINLMPIISCVSGSEENEDLITEFYRLMYTDPEVIEKEIQIHRNALPIKGFFQTYGHLMNPSVIRVHELLESDVVTPFITRAYTLYPEFAALTGHSINELMEGSLTVEDFQERLYELFSTF